MSRPEEDTMAHWIRALVAAATLLAVVTACTSAIKGNGGGGVSSSASCAAVLKFRGQLYYGSSLRTHAPYTRVARVSAAHLHGIGGGQFPPCQDTNHSTDETAQSVQVARIDGVDPGTAVAVLPLGSVFIKKLSLTVINSVLKSARGIRWDFSS
jgi:hypothetical protein